MANARLLGWSVGAGLLLVGCLAAVAAPVKVIAYINVTSGCQQPTVDLLQQLERRNSADLKVELVDFGDQGKGFQRWRESGYQCLTLEINGSPYVKFPEKGTQKVVAFKMPAGFLWSHEDLQAAVAAALAGQLQPATEAEAAAAQPPAHIGAEVRVAETTQGGRPAARVMLGGQEALLIVASAGGKGPKARAEAAAAALQTWLASPVKPSDIGRKQVQGGWAVLVAGKQVLVAGASDAKATGAAPEAVATKWAAGIKHCVMTAARPGG